MSRPPKCSGRPTGHARGGPKMAQDHKKTARVPPWEVLLSKLMDKINLGLLGLPFRRVWTHVAPKRCPLGPKWVHLGPECVLQAETKLARRTELRIRGQFSHVPTPTSGGFHPLSCLVLGRVQHKLMRVPAYTLSSAHIGHLKMSEDFCVTPPSSPLLRRFLLRPSSPVFLYS